MSRAAEETRPPEPVDQDPAASRAALPQTPQPPEDGLNRRYLVSFILTLLSMVQELRTQAEGQLFDLFTGDQVPVNSAMAPDTTFINVTVTNIDEASMMASLTLSGHRVCPVVCPETTATLYSLGNDAARRRGLPPSASVTVPANEGSYTYQVELPIRGKPQRYPFDDYTLLLGIAVENTFPGGITIPATRADVAANLVSFTLEDLVTRLDMVPPRTVDPAEVRSPNDPADFMLVDELQWQRPRYLRILTVLLVLLISASGIFALGLRSLHELVLGIGGIILGIWGVRSVVVQSALPDVTLIDLVLAFVMLILMLALAVRAARYFFQRSGLRQWRAARRAGGSTA
jgi:hypothetical protein